MSKKSIDKEFYPKAEEMMLSGMRQYQIVEELSKEYYDKKQISNNLDRIVHPAAREEVLRQRKIFASLASIIILLTVAIYLVFTYNGNLVYSLENKWFFYIYQILSAGGYLLELLPSLRVSKIGYKGNISSAVIIILLNITHLIKEPNFALWLIVLNIIAWSSILALNIIWFRASKKNPHLN